MAGGNLARIPGSKISPLVFFTLLFPRSRVFLHVRTVSNSTIVGRAESSALIDS